MNDENTYTEIGQQMRAVVDGMVKANFTVEEALRHFDRAFLARLLKEEHGNLCRAAQRAGLHRNTFSRRLPVEDANKVRSTVRAERGRCKAMRGMVTVGAVNENVTRRVA